MKFLFYSLPLFLLLTACGNQPDGPLEEYEIEKIEDEIVAAVQHKKLKLYSDKGLQHQIDPDEFDLLVPADSTGRQDLAGFGVITEEEMALNRGDFTNTSTDLAAVSLYVAFESNGYEQFLPVALVSWSEVAKVLNANYKRRFYEFLLGHFQSNIEAYRTEIARERLEFVNDRLFKALKNGEIAAYENDNLAHVKSPGELELFMAHKEEQFVPDPNNPDENIMKFVEVPISAQDITHYLAAYDENGKIVAITMMINEDVQGYPLNLPWVAMDIDEVEKMLDENSYNYLIEQIKAYEQEQEKPADSTATDTTQTNS
ncbi:hypothetical protein GC194_00780 [bacterium]|nr:hypothetical protein [bacterium]